MQTQNVHNSHNLSREVSKSYLTSTGTSNTVIYQYLGSKQVIITHKGNKHSTYTIIMLNNQNVYAELEIIK